LDTEVGRIDERQRDFFMSVRGKGTPERLIVATSAPTTIFGRSASRDDEKSSRAFFQLNLRRCFLPRAKWEDDEKKKWPNGDEVLDPTQVRLDLSGDVHQYARYWGPRSRTSHLARTDNPTAKQEEAPNYASVVSGLEELFITLPLLMLMRSGSRLSIHQRTNRGTLSPRKYLTLSIC